MPRQIVIDLTDAEATRARAALGTLQRKLDEQGAPRDATDEEVDLFVAASLRGVVMQQEAAAVVQASAKTREGATFGKLAGVAVKG